MPITEATTVVLVQPHYPENIGAVARAAKTMGITRLSLVRPGKLAVPEHEMAFKMAVRAWDVLGMSTRSTSLAEATTGFARVFATSGREEVQGALSPREAAQQALEVARAGGRIALVFGNEKTGLSPEEIAGCQQLVRIPMAADQPSINLAQAVQIVCYEWFLAGLAERDARGA
jgi:TrmH family RNA methyltransferase